VQVPELKALDPSVEALDDHGTLVSGARPLRRQLRHWWLDDERHRAEQRGIGVKNDGAFLELLKIAPDLEVLAQLLDRPEIAADEAATRLAGARTHRQLDERLDIAAHQFEIYVGPVGEARQRDVGFTGGMLVDGQDPLVQQPHRVVVVRGRRGNRKRKQQGGKPHPRMLRLQPLDDQPGEMVRGFWNAQEIQLGFDQLELHQDRSAAGFDHVNTGIEAG